MAVLEVLLLARATVAAALKLKTPAAGFTPLPEPNSNNTIL